MSRYGDEGAFRDLSGFCGNYRRLSPILCHGRVSCVDVKSDSFGVRFVEPCDLWQSSIRRALSTTRRNDWGTIRFHLPIDASVDVTDARSQDAHRRACGGELIMSPCPPNMVNSESYLTRSRSRVGLDQPRLLFAGRMLQAARELSNLREFATVQEYLHPNRQHHAVIGIKQPVVLHLAAGER